MSSKEGGMAGGETLLELLDFFGETIDSQAETIKGLTALLEKQAAELRNIKTVYGLARPSETDEAAGVYLGK